MRLLPDRLRPGTVPTFYADPYVEQQLLRQAALAQTGQAYFVNGLAYDDAHRVSVDTQERAILYDNAARYAMDHGIVLGQALTQEAINALDAPMLWYVEQKVRDKDGTETVALVPTVYLPRLYTDSHSNVAGGLIQGDDVTLDVSGTLTNTGYITASHSLSSNAQDFLNEKRQADLGRIVSPIEHGYTVTTGTTVQPGGFVSAATLQINASRIESISGEFTVLGQDQADTQAKTQAWLQQLKQSLGAAFSETQAQDDLHTEVHVEKGMDLTQIVILVAAIAISIYTAGAASALIGEAAGATAGSGSLLAAAGTTAGSLGAGLGNVALSAAVGSVASSTLTGAFTGNLSVENVLKAGVTAAFTAGLTNGITYN
ncbi:MAG: hypothetical protein ACRDRT_10525, partial [Pseudonocardiaceae bacterium]